jgi:hypothetical protein
MRERWAVKQAHFEVAKNAIQMNMAVEDIVRLTGLTREEVEDLRL